MSNSVNRKISKLIEDGKEIRRTNTTNGISGNFINGPEYDLWVTKCVDLMEKEFPRHHLKHKLKVASSRAVGNGPKYYDEIVSVLTVLIDDELVSDDDTQVNINEDGEKYNKIFVSHSSKDKNYVEQLIKLLNNIGIKKSKKYIFCSSFEGYNIPIGEKIYDYIKSEITSSTLVIFVLSKNYYESPACLNEMGAAWINSKKHMSILVPDFDFSSIEGAIDPTEICIKFDNKERINSFKKMIGEIFDLSDIDGSI